MDITIKGLNDLADAAKLFIEATKDNNVIAFNGGMGAGKTTFISEVCRQLGVEEDTSSPTFAIINEYESSKTGEKIYHFDCYRLESPEEAFDLGAEDYLLSGAKCFIEWPEMIEALLPDDVLTVSIREEEDGRRIVSF